MRIVTNKYADVEQFAVETASDGSVVLRDLMGQRRPGARIFAYAEVACDDNERGLERLEDLLEYLLQEVRRRREQPADARKTTRVNMSGIEYQENDDTSTPGQPKNQLNGSRQLFRR
jgi:hypothetical protein